MIFEWFLINCFDHYIARLSYLQDFGHSPWRCVGLGALHKGTSAEDVGRGKAGIQTCNPLILNSFPQALDHDWSPCFTGDFMFNAINKTS